MDASLRSARPHAGVLAALSMAAVLSALGTSVANVALPTLCAAFAAPFHDVQWVVIAYVLAVTVLVVFAGRLGDLVGRRRLLVGGIALFTAASAACALAPTLALLVAARAAQGTGAAVMMALALAFVGDAIPRGKSGRAMGLLGTMSAIGTALGPSLGGLLIVNLGWRSIFAVNVPLGLVALGLAWRYLPASGAAASRPPRPALLPMGLIRTPAFARGLAASTLVSTVMMATLVVGPFHLSLALGLAPAAVGVAISVGPAVVALAGLPAGTLVDRIGTQRVIFAGLIAMAIGSLALFATSTAGGLAGYLLPIVVITSGYALFQTSNNTAVMAPVAAEDRGAASGLLGLSRNLGLVMGASFMGAVFAAASGSSDPASALPGAVAQGTQATFGVAAILILMAIVVQSWRGESLRHRAV